MHWEPRGILRFLPTSTQNAHPREGPKVSTDMRRKDDPGNTKNARMVLNSLRKILYVYARKSQFTFNDSCCQRTIRAHGGNMKRRWECIKSDTRTNEISMYFQWMAHKIEKRIYYCTSNWLHGGHHLCFRGEEYNFRRRKRFSVVVSWSTSFHGRKHPTEKSFSAVVGQQAERLVKW